MSTPSEIAAKAIEQLNQKITDEVFLIIQKDRQLMHQYLRAVEKDGLDQVNQIIGKTVKLHYHLENADSRQENPVSPLIQSHQKFI